VPTSYRGEDKLHLSKDKTSLCVKPKLTLTGGSGGDLLIVGQTSYETNAAALAAGVSYTDNTGTHTALLDSSTVLDGVSDKLNGGSGMD
jgi:hypothetical protein